MKAFYLVLAIMGVIVPYSFFACFLAEHGPDGRLFFSQLFANSISTFFVADLILSIVVFWVYVYREALKWKMGRWWLYVAASMFIGLSFALPMFLFFREKRMKAAT